MITKKLNACPRSAVLAIAARLLGVESHAHPLETLSATSDGFLIGRPEVDRSRDPYALGHEVLLGHVLDVSQGLRELATVAQFDETETRSLQRAWNGWLDSTYWLHPDLSRDSRWNGA